MPRSRVLSGLVAQRDRAHQRGRLDAERRRTVEPSAPDETLADWLDHHGPRGDPARIETLELDEILRATAEIALAPEERLRQVAAWLEATLVASDEQPRAWLALDRIYRAALKLATDDASVHRSRAVSARRCAEALQTGGPGAHPHRDAALARMRAVASDACSEAIRCAPDSPDPWFTLGRLRYGDRSGGPAVALEGFEQALVRDPAHAWSLLYRAHCLQDLERWREAALGYADLPPAFFTGARAWRYEHLLEQRAWCWLRANDVARATTEFEALLSRWERSPALAREAWGTHVVEAAEGPLREALHARVSALAERAKAEQDRGQTSPWPGLVSKPARALQGESERGPEER